MYLARLLGAIGRTLISAGVIVLLFVAYQLWGTGVQTQQAQKSLQEAFLASIDSDAAAELRSLTAQPTPDPSAQVEETDTETEAEPDGPVLVETSFAASDISASTLAAMYPDIGEPLARVVIPAIEVDNIVVEGVRVSDLRKGPGHYDGTPMPGQRGNAAIAGHRTTYSAPFNRVDELNPGDEIKVTTSLGIYTYKVLGNEGPDGEERGYFIVSPQDTWVLGQDDRNMLTLTACHPKFSARQRIIVQAELVGDPAPTIPRIGSATSAGTNIAELNAGSEEGTTNIIVGDTNVDTGSGDSGQTVGIPATADGTDTAAGTDGTAGTAGAEGIAGADGTAADPNATDGTAAGVDGTGADAAGADGVGISTDIDSTTGVATGADGITTDDFGEGLDGDPTKVRPAIIWGAAACSIWLCAWFIGYRLERHLLVYAIGIVPFSFVLWACFVNVDQALPSY